ncbi:MAG TPA: DNA ligase D, partial [Pseudogracilibacillus sp.]|nr:DNA ligase D [Pseudogracilibacillus sp.]
MKVMKPIRTNDIPHGDEWVYEVKYDGFRCVLHWNMDGVKLTSKNNKNLTTQFPEIIAYCEEKHAIVQDFLPLKIDGELVILNNPYQANFARIQQRGRLKNKETIDNKSDRRPASFMAFDIISHQGASINDEVFVKRKKLLQALCEQAYFDEGIQFVPAYQDPTALWDTIFAYHGEGMIAKRKNSTYAVGKKHQAWFKIKNWRTIKGFLTEMDLENGYFTVGVYDGEDVQTIGKCKHGLDAETIDTLKQLFMTNGEKQGNVYTLPPAICAAIHTLGVYDDELREPEFKQLLPNEQPATCTVEQLQLDIAMIPEKIEQTNTAKIFWPEKGLTKGDLLVYIREVAPYMLPFLQDKALTAIRAPDGVDGESFFQKNRPAYAPDFIESVVTEDKNIIICNQLDTLVWFANHGTVEYHIPFQKVTQQQPDEIVFDLDPPGREKFAVAIEAALMIKTLLDELALISFVKTSGNKGLQIHIPIEVGSMTYEETALFTEAIASTLVTASPHLFT